MTTGLVVAQYRRDSVRHQARRGAPGGREGRRYAGVDRRGEDGSALHRAVGPVDLAPGDGHGRRLRATILADGGGGSAGLGQPSHRAAHVVGEIEIRGVDRQRAGAAETRDERRRWPPVERRRGNLTGGEVGPVDPRGVDERTRRGAAARFAARSPGSPSAARCRRSRLRIPSSRRPPRASRPRRAAKCPTPR